MEACEGTVEPAVETQFSNVRAPRAHSSRKGVVGRPWSYRLSRSARTVSHTIHSTLGRGPAAGSAPRPQAGARAAAQRARARRGRRLISGCV